MTGKQYCKSVVVNNSSELLIPWYSETQQPYIYFYTKQAEAAQPEASQSDLFRTNLKQVQHKDHRISPLDTQSTDRKHTTVAHFASLAEKG
jgi:hypothetical protein